MNKMITATLAATALGIAALAGCGPTTTQSAESATKPATLTVDQWKATVRPTVHKLGDDLTNIENAANAGDTAAATKACTTGLHDTATLQADAPWPGKAARWNKVLDQLSTAFASCVAGDYTSGTAGLAQATEGLNSLEQGG